LSRRRFYLLIFSGPYWLCVVCWLTRAAWLPARGSELPGAGQV